MIKGRDCPICGGDINFRYVTPDKNFYILNGVIEHDSNNLVYEEEGLVFQCSNDATHDLYGGGDHPEISLEQEKWEDTIDFEFKEKIRPELL
jgi:hypothetical protein